MESLAQPAIITVKPISNALFLVKVVQNPVSVILEPGRENDDLVVFSHFNKEGGCMRPGSVVISAWVEVHQSFIQVQDQRVRFVLILFYPLIHWRQKRISISCHL